MKRKMFPWDQIEIVGEIQTRCIELHRCDKRFCRTLPLNRIASQPSSEQFAATMFSRRSMAHQYY